MSLSLAWAQLTRERRRLAVALAGIAFVVMLVFVQLGFQEALYEAGTRMHRHLLADVVLISPQYQYLLMPLNFTQRRIYQACGFEGVESVAPLHIGYSFWEDPQSGASRMIMILGMRPGRNVFDLPEVEAQTSLLQQPDVALFDEMSRPVYGSIVERVRTDGVALGEVADRRVEVRGLFRLGPSMAYDGYLLTSDQTFLKLVPRTAPGLIEVGLIRLKPGADPARVAAALNAALPPDVVALTRQGYCDRERRYWAVSTPIGYYFKFGVMMALVVGAVIVYQILYTDVTSQLPQYATLKAMGYTDVRLVGVVLKQGLMLCALGYLPGWACACVVTRFAAEFSRLPVRIAWTHAVETLALIAVMACVGAALAIRRLSAADPAEIF